MESFSKILQLSDLNDFINVSQDCIKPVKPNKVENTKTEDGKVKMHHVSLTKPSISIDDCLACKGCVTSADTVLLEHQRAEDFLKILNSNSFLSPRKLIVMSVSPQSIASIASKFHTSMSDIYDKLKIFFQNRGCDVFFDTSIMREISLLESGKEFVTRYTNNSTGLPMLSSSCPGWICYAEKVQGDYILPNISNIRSQLQIAGSFVKNFFYKQILDSNSDVKWAGLYHVSVMPCYDRKLEAIRKEFKLSEDENLVDSVLTTTELLYIYENPDLINLSSDIVNDTALNSCDFLSQYSWCNISRENSESDGYLYYIANYIAKQLFNCDNPIFTVSNIRNEDMQEILVNVGSEHEPLLFAKAYGFKNIQILLQSIKKRRKKYHFIEIMACPSGCLNGGGQIILSDNLKESLALIKNTYNENENNTNTGDTILSLIYKNWLISEEEIVKNIFTSYSAASKSIMTITNQW